MRKGLCMFSREAIVFLNISGPSLVESTDDEN